MNRLRVGRLGDGGLFTRPDGGAATAWDTTRRIRAPQPYKNFYGNI